MRRLSAGKTGVLLLVVASFVTIPTPVLHAQGNSKKLDAVGLRRLPDSVQANVKALGQRSTEKEKDETLLTGTFVDGFGGPPLQVRVVQELSGEVTLEGFKDKKTIAFDGKDVSGVVDDIDEALLETFAIDTAEGLFVSLGEGASLQVLGYGFKLETDNRVSFDIYDVGVTVKTQVDHPVQLKRYYFDAATGLLVSTRYAKTVRGRLVQIESRFSDWQNVEGSFYAGRVDRFEDGRLLFSFRATGVRNGKKGQAGNSQQ